MNVLFCSSEVVPFAKTGGLADVAGTLPLELKSPSLKVKVAMPRYRCIDIKKYKLEKIGEKAFKTSLGKNREVLFIENKKLFDRDGLYQEKGIDYPDNLARFAYFCQETLKLIKKIKFKPDVIHCNDWQTALIPVYIKTKFADDHFYKNIKTVFTIHNLGYQGLFPKEEMPITGLDDKLFSVDGLEFYGKVNLLKGGLLFSDKITTVSPTYAKEIQAKEFGCGLEGVLKTRQKDLLGILNGINYEEWDPQKNKHLVKNYGLEDIDGKYENKAELQKICSLEKARKKPVLGIVTRLADQKGLDILAEVIEKVVQMPVQFVLLGTGDQRYHVLFEKISKKYKNTSIHLTFNAELAYKIYAGSDIFLMPSHYEPCGLGQLISLKFGTVPLVRKTGGLADTVVDYTISPSKGNGFVFSEYTAEALWETINRALTVYKNSSSWKKLIKRGMKSDFSWGKSAKEYVKLYKNITG